MQSPRFAAMAAGALAALVPAALFPAAQARADVFVLTGGGQIEGMLANPSESPRERYVVKISTLGEIVLSKDQVKAVHKPKANEKEYHKLRPQFADTAEGQWALAEWCKAHNLKAERTLHLERVIEIDPEHLKARQVLGYTRKNGEWKTTDEIQGGLGLKKDPQGRWRTQQQIDDLQREKVVKEAEKKWLGNIRRWRGWWDGDRQSEALAEFEQLNDPHAVPALLNYMKNETDVAVRRVFVDALIRIATPDAVHALGNYAMEDADDELRATCLEYLAKENHPGAVDFFIKRLLHKDNVMVNRAGFALGKMKDQRAVRPLIDALVTTHKFQVQAGNGNNMNTGFGGGAGGGGFSFGGGGPQIIDRDLQNPDVHGALTELTGVNFDYDERAWRDWLSAQKKAPVVDARRGD